MASGAILLRASKGIIDGGGFQVSRKPGVVPSFALLVLLSLATSSASAEPVYFKVGDDVKTSCEGTAAGEAKSSTAEYLLCLGYLQGVVDTDVTYAEWSQYPRQICIPKGVTSSGLRQVFLEWLNAKPPEYLSFGAASLVLTAYSETWPCNTE